MKQLGKTLTVACAVALMVMSASCAKKQVREEPAAGVEPVAPAAEPVEEAAPEGQLEEADIDSTTFREIDPANAELQAIFQDIHFDFDDFSLKPAARETLRGIAEWMLQNPSTQVLVEGHCDERGTTEYNLALGERRANSAEKYLVQLGVARSRITTISYGEEKPLDPGHTEEAWAKNRRGHFLIR